MNFIIGLSIWLINLPLQTHGIQRYWRKTRTNKNVKCLWVFVDTWTPFPVNTHWQRRGEWFTGKHPPATGKKKRPLKDWKLLKTSRFISGDVLSQSREEVRSAESTEGLTTYFGNGWGVFTEIYLIILWINCSSNGPLDLTVEGQPVGYFCHTVGFGMLHADQCRRWRSQNNPENETKVHQTDWHLLVSSSTGVNR